MYTITDYGAVPGGETLCTAAIQTCIDTCARCGGGTVMVPAGCWLTGTIWLRSNVELHLENGAVLKASPNLEDYNAEDAYPENYGWPPEEWNGKHLIICYRCENVAITGNGILDGSADEFFEPLTEVNRYYCWMDGIVRARDKVNLRPGQLVTFILSDHLRVENVTARNTPCWCFFFHGCSDVSVRGVRVFNPPYYANTDGIDVDCCHYVTISDCVIRTGDDCIAIRGQNQRQHRFEDCGYITVTNCVLNSASSVFRIGVGKGLIHDVRVSNIVVERGSTVMNYCCGWDGAPSYMENVHFSDLSIHECSHVWNVGGEFWGKAGTVRHCGISNVTATATATNYIKAAGECTIEDFTLRHIRVHFKNREGYGEHMRAERGGDMLCFENVRGLCQEDVRVTCEESQRDTWEHTVVSMNVTE